MCIFEQIVVLHTIAIRMAIATNPDARITALAPVRCIAHMVYADVAATKIACIFP